MATMASLTSLAALFVLLIVQIHARESQFFSKVTSNPTDAVELPDRQQSLVNQQEEQPEFEPETQNGYGLYGHETGLFPPGTETKSGVQTHTPGTYSSEKYFNNDRPETEQLQNSNGETFYTSKKKFNPGSDDDDLLNFDNMYKSSNDDLLNFEDETNANAKTEAFYKGGETERYEQTQKGNRFGGGESYYSNFGSRAAQKGTDSVNDNEVSAYEAYRAQLQSRGGSGRQGMSDTRFLENGRYYYDLNQERSQSQYGDRKTYNPNYSSNSNSNYDANELGNRAYQGEKAVGGGESYKNNFYDNSGGEKYEFNTMEEYERSRQNQYDP